MTSSPQLRSTLPAEPPVQDPDIGDGPVSQSWLSTPYGNGTMRGAARSFGSGAAQEYVAHSSRHRRLVAMVRTRGAPFRIPHVVSCSALCGPLEKTVCPFLPAGFLRAS